jgi:hypothetical protein
MTARERADFPIRFTDFYLKVLAIFSLASNPRSLYYVGLVERRYWDCYQGSHSFVLSNTKA